MAVRHEEDARLRALAFWVGHHQAHEPAPRIGPAPAVRSRAAVTAVGVVASEALGASPEDRAARAAARDQRIGELAAMVPQLKVMASDSRPAVRATVARCFGILATAGRAPADREVWRMLLGLAKYDEDAAVRTAADAALAALERHGAVAVTVAAQAS
ncbi:hypothetical protein [Demequina sp. NBRC 110053]|uniref:hypothetical protein n=1 Tax=Demequina sp. NBRC 110053 TaxID=1570342 RepID=UPI001184976E|nr:hypothetical protein [Demequina sp. NBRC 110053]